MLTGCDRRGTTMGHFNIGQFFKDPKVKELTLAATRGNVSRIAELVKEGVDVNAVEQEGFTPLLWVISQEPINYIGLEALLKHGANPNFIPPANSQMSDLSVTYLLGGGENTAALRMVLKYGGNPNIVDPEDNASGNHQTVLIAAAQRGKIENMKLLLKYGAKIDGTDGDDMTPLLSAAMMNQYKAAYFLLEHGANYKYRGHVYSTKKKAGIERIISESLRAGLGDEQIPWQEKVIKWLEAHGVPRPKPAPY